MVWARTWALDWAPVCSQTNHTPHRSSADASNPGSALARHSNFSRCAFREADFSFCSNYNIKINVVTLIILLFTFVLDHVYVHLKKIIDFVLCEIKNFFEITTSTRYSFWEVAEEKKTMGYWPHDLLVSPIRTSHRWWVSSLRWPALNSSWIVHIQSRSVHQSACWNHNQNTFVRKKISGAPLCFTLFCNAANVACIVNTYLNRKNLKLIN